MTEPDAFLDEADDSRAAGETAPASGRPPGPRFGDYVLGPLLGRGGMASVYLARHEAAAGAARLVALKIVAGLGNARFQREASVALRLEHPNIVRTYDVGQTDGRAYIAMELVWGVDLSRLPRPLPPPICRRIGADVARALHFAHELHGLDGRPLQLVHQDVSPQNVMVTYDGSVRLLDFGVARLGVVDASRTDTVAGKPAYLAPEQLEGTGLDRRVDVFALGVVLHELVTGERLFARGSVAETYRAVLFEPIPDVRALPGGETLPADVATVLQQTLYRDPSQRFSSAASFASAWAQAWDGGGVAAASDAELAAFARAARPPEQTPAEMEQSLVASLPTRDGLALPLARRATRTRSASSEPADVTQATLSERVVVPVDTSPRRTGLFFVVAALLVALAPASFFALRRPAPPEIAAVPSGSEPIAPQPSDGGASGGDRVTGDASAAPAASPLADDTSVPDASKVVRTAHVPQAPAVAHSEPRAPVPPASSASSATHAVSIRTTRGEQQQTVTLVGGQTSLVRFVF